MPTLPLPNLDDRRWEDLVDEGRSLIPFYAPEWTDHNAHDPGISLLELFAWVAEQDLYAVNRVTDTHRRKLLALAGGVAPHPPRPAGTLLAFGLAASAPPRRLPAGLEVEGDDPFGAPVRFRTLHELTVQPGRIAALLGGRPPAPADLTAAWRRGEPLQPFGADPAPGDAFYLGFELPAAWPAGTVLRLGFAAAGPDGGPTAAERERIAQEAAGRAQDCRPPWQPCGPAAGPADDPPTGRPRHHSARLLWEVATGPRRWTRLPLGAGLDDDTRALTLDGQVVAELPEPVAPVAVAGHPRPLAWLRARLVRGAYDAPPVLRGIAFNAAEAVQAVPAVVRLRIAPGAPVAGTPPAPGGLASLDLQVNGRGEVARLTFGPPAAGRPAVRVLAFDAPGRWLTIEAGAVARGNGAPSQRLQVPRAPTVADSVHLASLEDGAWRRWALRVDFDASGRADAHFLLDPTSGTVTLGDGERGRTAAPGSTLLVTAALTRAGDGNLPAGAVTRLADSPHNQAAVPDLGALAAQLASITNVVPATGGSPAETLDAAGARAREDRERPARAVTLDDHVTLARETPGVRLARAEARANFHPGFPCLTAPGIVTVLVLPSLPAGRPAPSPGLREAVAAYLDRRRVIGTRVEVAGPVYVTVTVRATVQVCPDASGAELGDAVRDALDTFFHPLTGGPDGTGWPVGRDVYRSEVLQVIDEVPGVASVLALELVGGGSEPSCGNLCLGPTGLVAAGPHEVDVR
jgi:predicted phage baseplate assembly protein